MAENGPFPEHSFFKTSNVSDGVDRGLPHLESRLDETRQPTGQRNRDKMRARERGTDARDKPRVASGEGLPWGKGAEVLGAGHMSHSLCDGICSVLSH